MAAVMLPLIALVSIGIPRYLASEASISGQMARAQQATLTDIATFLEQISSPNKPSKLITLAERFQKRLAAERALDELAASHPRVAKDYAEFGDVNSWATELYLTVKSDVNTGGNTTAIALLTDPPVIAKVSQRVRSNYQSIMEQLANRVATVNAASEQAVMLTRDFEALVAARDDLISRASIAKAARTPDYEQTSAIREVASRFAAVESNANDPDVERAGSLGVTWCNEAADYYEAYARYTNYLENSYAPNRSDAESYLRGYLLPLREAGAAGRAAIARVKSARDNCVRRSRPSLSPQEISYKPLP